MVETGWDMRRRRIDDMASGSCRSMSPPSAPDGQGGGKIEATKTFDRDRRRSSLKSLAILFLVAPLLGTGALFVAVLRGSDQERDMIKQAASTQSLYTDENRVCAGRLATGAVGSGDALSTFPTLKAAREASESDVVHCGACGHCSTTNDMTLMAETTRTLTDAATWCSTKGIISSLFLWRGVHVYRRVAKRCMEESVSFTPNCQECWLDDMVCCIRECFNTCLKSVYFLREPKNGQDGRINSCLECDEKICGPAFLECSGSNRRRQGIHSDIRREDDKELCQSVSINWANDRYLEG